MTLYRYDLLSPSQFEDLVILVAAAHFKASRYEMFGEGPDGGVDGIVEFKEGDRVVRLAIQAKRHNRYPTSQVLDDIRKFDKDRFDGLLIVTSANPTPDTVEKTAKAFAEHAPSGIYHHWTGSRLDSQINEDPACAINFSVIASYDSPLHRLLQSPAVRRGAEELSRIANQKSLAVTDLVDTVARTTVNRKVCIVTGRAGIGKTTTSLLAAQQIITEYRHNGKIPPLLASLSPYDDVSVPIDTSLPIIYFYDDFLGPTSLTTEAQRGNIREVLRLVGNCRTGENFLILTSRNYLIGDYFRAREEQDLYGAFGIDDSEACVIECDTRLMRAQILAAQLRGYLDLHRDQMQSDSFGDFKKAFLDKRRYKEILRAKHFDPRALIVTLANEKHLDLGTLDRILRGMGNLHQQYKDGFLSLTGEEKDFLRLVLIAEESDYPNYLHVSDPVEISHLIRALEGIWVDRFEIMSRDPSQSSGRNFRLANPSIREFLSNRFAGKRFELTRTWEAAVEIGKAQAVFNILIRYMRDAENYSSLSLHLLRLAGASASLSSQVLAEKVVSLGASCGDEAVRKLARLNFERWLEQNVENVGTVNSSFYVDVLHLTQPSVEGAKRSPAVADFLCNADVESESLNDLIHIHDWVLVESDFTNHLEWVERELEIEWDALLQDIQDRPNHYASSKLGEEATVFNDISQTFDLRWGHSVEELELALDEARDYFEQYQDYMVNMNERPRSVSTTSEVHTIMSSAFSIDR